MLALAALLLAPAAWSQATRTWVSGVGDDANPCSRTAPCKTFAGAISKTAAGGMINVIDSGGFGAVTITKSITIDGQDMQAGVLASGTNGINVNGAGINVILRDLSIEGAGTGLIGVNYIQGASLTVDNCRIFGFQSGTATGIRVALSGSGKVLIKDSAIQDNFTGVQLQTSAGQLLATLDNVNIANAVSFGVVTTGAGQVFSVIKRSTIQNNAGSGVQAGSASSIINLIDSTVAFNNATAVNAGVSGSRIRISGDSILNNNVAIGIAAGATVESDGTNRVAGFSSSAPPNGVFTNQ